jgi:hypothetical protein
MSSTAIPAAPSSPPWWTAHARSISELIVMASERALAVLAIASILVVFSFLYFMPEHELKAIEENVRIRDSVSVNLSKEDLAKIRDVADSKIAS